MEAVNQHKTVMEQYKTSDNLATRISIHAKYSVNKLELGCGTGELWRSRLDLLDSRK